jgi:cytochrome c556
MKTGPLKAAGVAAALLAGLAVGCNRNSNSSAGSQAARNGAAGANEAATTIAEIMQKVNKGKDALHRVVGDQLKADPVDWPAVQKNTKEYAALAEFLGKNDPPKGDKASWESLTKAYTDDARALNDAAGKNDKAAALAVHQKISDSCMTCHQSHRGRGRGPG